MSARSPWWLSAAVYQIYIRSFADGDGDGTGDLAGIRSRLEYLAALGVDAIWINPWYLSPFKDGGYDVADYRRIDPRFGTDEEAYELIAEARRHGIRVLLDLVPNHTSSLHPWFQEALRSAPGSPARQRYHFVSGPPPNNWKSVFGGPAWTRLADGDSYLHLFDPDQPDLNWANPEVRDEFDAIIQFWLDRGASGFRVDVAHGLGKDQGYPDLTGAETHLLDSTGREGHPFWDRDELHEVVRRWRKLLDRHGPDTMMVAEAWVEDWDRLHRYLRPGEYHQVFDFEFLLARWDVAALRTAIEHSLEGAGRVGSVPTWVLSNHDVVRHATRYGLPQSVDPQEWLRDGDRSLYDEELGRQRARAAALLMLALPGSVYLYQGEELGLPEVVDLPPDVLDDPTWVQSGGTVKGRDGCRVPLPWTIEGASAGFGINGAWLPQPEGWGRLSVEAQSGAEGSTLELYRSALAIRRAHLIADVDLEWLDLGGETLAFRRGTGVVCVVNCGAEPIPLPGGELLCASAPLVGGQIPSDAAVWVRTR